MMMIRQRLAVTRQLGIGVMSGLILVLIVLAAGAGLAGGPGQSLAEAPTALSSAFTYQGALWDEDMAVDGACDFTFALYDAATSGSQLGVAETKSGVAVSQGRFTVLLNESGQFGPNAFNGEARWLEPAVRCPAGSGEYTTLIPRQQLTTAPYAIYAGGAPWSGLSGVPAGLDDGDDDTTYTAGSGLALNGTEFSAQGSPFANVVVVAKSGGDFSSVQAALDSIGDAGPSKPYLVFVAPGVYEEQVALKPYVTLEGAGEGTTIVRWTGGNEEAFSGNSSATLVGADNAVLRHLTVESDGTGKDYAVAIHNENASPTISNVTATASDSSSGKFGVFNYNSSSPTMTNVTATASGSSAGNYGVYNYNSSSPTMINVTARGSGGSSGNYGVANTSSSPTIRHSVLEGSSNSVYRFSGLVKVANSQLIGDVSPGVICFGNYDADLNAVTCPEA